jgi:hypothetical protein
MFVVSISGGDAAFSSHGTSAYNGMCESEAAANDKPARQADSV